MLPCKCDGSSYIDKHRKHIVTGDLHIIKNNVLRNLFTKGLKFRETKSINFDRAKPCILAGLEECIQIWCNENGVKKLFPEWNNNITTKTDDRINVLNENLHQHKTHDTLSSPTVRTALDQIICKRF